MDNVVLWFLSILAIACLVYGLSYRYSPVWPPGVRRAAWIISSLVVAWWLIMIIGMLDFSIKLQLFVIQLRSWRALEWTQIFFGVFAALVQLASNSRKMPESIFSRHYGLILVIFLLFPLYWDSLIFPCHARWANEWKDGVCLQSEGYTCTAAATATLLRLHGRTASEEAVSRRIRMSASGAYNWEVLRLLRLEGLHPRLASVPAQPRDLPVPCLAVVRLGDRKGIPHMLAILEKTDKTFVIGDPLGGRFEWSKETTWKNYWFSGVVIGVEP